MRSTLIAAGAAVCLVASYGGAHAFKLGGPGGTCPKVTKIQCQVFCDNGQLAD